MKIAISHGLSADMFSGYREEWEFLETYFSKYRKVPTKAAFRMKFPDFGLKAVNDTGHFADEVRKTYARKQLTSAGQEMAEHLHNGDVDAAVELIQKSVITIAAGLGVNNDSDILRNFDDVMEDVDTRRERFQEHGAAGLPTGFITLDERTGGPQPGELWIIGARLGVGKSWVMQRMAAAAVMAGRTVQFDALEQSRSQVAMRIYSMLSGQMGKGLFDSQSLMKGKDYDPVAFRKFVKSLREDIKGRLHVADTSRGKVSSLTVASQIERNLPDAVFIDYLTLMKKNGPDWQGVAELSSDLLNTANEYQLPIIAASQLNREHGLSKNEPPGPEALSQADAIGQDATAVITMCKMSDSVLIMKLAKHRNAPDGFKWYVHFDPAHGKFEEITHSEALEVKDRDDDLRDMAAVKAQRAQRRSTPAPKKRIRR